VFDELDNIMADEKVTKKSEAFNRMVEFSQVGREAKKLNRLLFGGH
jgi:hypothetical protein